MIQTMGRFRRVVTDSAGTALASISVEVRRQGATCRSDAGGTAPRTISVDEIGAIRASDTVEIYTEAGALATATTFNVDSVDSTASPPTITLSGATIPAITNNSRLSPTNSLPSLYLDPRGNESASNPLTTSSDGSAPAWTLGGYYDVKESGSGYTTKLITDVRVPSVTPYTAALEPRYGSVADASTNDGPALQRAIEDLVLTSNGLASGGTLVLPRGTHITNQQIVVPSQVRLVGQGRNATFIKAGASFPTSTALIRLGRGAATYAPGARLEFLSLDCNDIAGSIGLLSTEADNLAGLRCVSVLRAILYGVHLSTSISGACTLEGVEIAMSDSASAVTAKGIFLDASAGVIELDNITVGSYSGGSTDRMLAGIHCSHTNGHVVVIRRAHCEQATNGIKVSQPGVIVDGASGFNGMTNVLLIDAGIGQVSARMIFVAGATNAIKDNNRSLTLASDNVPFYETGIAGDNSLILFDDTGTVAWLVQNPVTWSGAHTHNAAVTVAAGQNATLHRLLEPFESVAAATTTSITKNSVRLTGASPVTISTIQVAGGTPTSAHDGMEVYFRNKGSASFTFDQGGNIETVGTSIVLAAGEGVRFRFDFTDTKWIQASQIVATA